MRNAMVGDNSESYNIMNYIIINKHILSMEIDFLVLYIIILNMIAFSNAAAINNLQ